MKKGENTPAETAAQALMWLKSKVAGNRLPRTEADAHRIIRELQRQQAALEKQNEELRQAWEELESTPDRYEKMYVLSPVGYFTFDANGLIRDVNSAGSQMLGIERGLLADQSFFSFIADAVERDIFSRHLESVMQGEGIQRCEIRLTGNDGTSARRQLLSIAVDTAENTNVHILTSIVGSTYGKMFVEELQNAHDKLELSQNERIEELTRSLRFLADSYHSFESPDRNHEKASGGPVSTGGFDRHDSAAIVQNGNHEEPSQPSIAAGRKNSGFLPVTGWKDIRLYVLCAFAVVAVVSLLLPQANVKTAGTERKITRKNLVRSFELRTSARKTDQEKNTDAVIEFKVIPEGVIYIDGEKKGVAPKLREVEVNNGRHTILIKYKNYKAYRRVIIISRQKRILIVHRFGKRKNTDTVKTTTSSKPTGKADKLPQKSNLASSTASTTTKNKAVIKSTSSAVKTTHKTRKINPSAFSSSFTPR